MLNETFNAFLDDMREQNPACLNKIHSGMCKMLISNNFQILKINVSCPFIRVKISFYFYKIVSPKNFNESTYLNQ